MGKLHPIREKLTKKFYLSLPEGVYLTSNCYDNHHLPKFAEFVVATGQAREIQWEIIKAAGADQNLCNVFKSREEYVEFADKLLGIPSDSDPDDIHIA